MTCSHSKKLQFLKDFFSFLLLGPFLIQLAINILIFVVISYYSSNHNNLMSPENSIVADPAEPVIAVAKSKNQPYYTIVTDLKGKCLLFNYSGEVSDSPFEGFTSPLSEELKIVINDIISGIEKPFDGFAEYSRVIDTHESSAIFLITRYISCFKGEQVCNWLIRPAGYISEMLDQCNKKLTEERNLYKINTKCISSVSHDFRTPLSIIYANLQLLEHHELQLDKETIEDAFSLSRMAVKSLLRVLDKVTVIDSMNKGRLENKPGKQSLKSLCTNLVKELNDAEIITDRIVYSHDEAINEVEIDEYLFRSLFAHLIANSLVYSKKDRKVFFESRFMDTNNIRFTIKDSGIGFTAEQIDTISVFIANKDSYIKEGIGLGFSIIKECLLLLKGEFSIISTPGKGSEFNIVLPLKIN